MNTYFRSFVAIVCMSAVFAVAFAVDAARAVFAYVAGFLRDIEPVTTLKKPKPKCGMAMVQAKAYLMRMARRDRPTVMASWRMCPSA